MGQTNTPVQVNLEHVELVDMEWANSALTLQISGSDKLVDAARITSA